MKKFLLSVIGMILMTSITFAQQSNKSDSSCSKLYGKSYWHLSTGLNPMTLKTTYIGEDIASESVSTNMTGVSLGFTHGIRMMKTQPFYLEVGAKLLYAFRNEAECEIENIGKTWEMKENLLALNVPVVVTWQFEALPKVCIAPYLGLNMRCNILGQSKTIKYRYRYHDDRNEYYLYETDTQKTNWFKKYEGNCNQFNVGLTFGANFTFNRFILGLGYTKDVTKFMREPGVESNIEYFTISGGLRF